MSLNIYFLCDNLSINECFFSVDQLSSSIQSMCFSETKNYLHLLANIFTHTVYKIKCTTAYIH